MLQLLKNILRMKLPPLCFMFRKEIFLQKLCLEFQKSLDLVLTDYKVYLLQSASPLIALFTWWIHTKVCCLKTFWKLFDCTPSIGMTNDKFSITPLLEHLIIILICKLFSFVCRNDHKTSPYNCRTPVPCTLPPFPSGLHLWLFDWHNRTVARLSGILSGMLKVMLRLITWPENTLDALVPQFKHK